MDFYRGIKEAYPKLPLPEKIKGFIALMRPLTLIAAVIAGFSMSYVFASLTGGLASFPLSILTGLVLGFLQSAGQAFNQSLLVEMEIDKANNKEYRPTLQGTVSFEEGKIFAFFLFLAGVSLAFMLASTLGFFALLITLFAITYSAPPFRIKEKFLLNNLHQAAARGLLPVLYVASVYGYGSEAVLFGGVLMLWIIGAQTSKDFTDIPGDEKFGVMTFPVKLGRRKAVWLMSGFMASAFLALSLLTVLRFLPRGFLWLNLLILPSTIIVYGLNFRLKRWENNLGWLFWYLTLALWYLLPPVLI